jgi:hypothetical protein
MFMRLLCLVCVDNQGLAAEPTAESSSDVTSQRKIIITCHIIHAPRLAIPQTPEPMLYYVSLFKTVAQNQ